ncbi:MAG: TonB-dependent receptor [Bacteroidia bacterium]|nr:TonB-dependent receptor [Bacteroidia bacterium]
MKYFIICLLLAGIAISSSWAQDCSLTVEGILMGESSQQPLAFASVQIKEKRIGTFTDSLGHFKIEGLCPGTYTFICDHIACEHLEISMRIDSAENKRNFILKHHELHVDEVTISRKKAEEYDNTVVSQIEGQALEENVGKQLGDILAKIPGVNVLKTGPSISKPIIHGLHSNRVLILNNGIRQEGQQWGSEHAPEIDPFIANKLTVVKGASGLRYGPGAIGGVVLVEPEDMRDSVGIGGKIHLQGQSNGRVGIVSGHLEGKVPNFRPLSWRIQGTIKKGGNFHTPGYFMQNTATREQNFSGHLRYETFSKGWELFYSQFNSIIGILSPAHLGGRRDLERALASPTPIGADTVGFTYDFVRPYQDIKHHLAKAKYFWRIPSLGKINAVYSFQHNNRREFDKHKPRGTDENGEDKAELDFSISTHTLEANLEHSLSTEIEGVVGGAGVYQNNLLKGRMFIPNYVLFGGEVFWIEKWRRDNWELEGGIRYDYRWVHSAREEAGIDIFSIRDFQSFSANLGGNLFINRKLTATVNLGRAWRPPHVNELFSDGLHHGAGAIEIGDSTLNSEKAIKLVGSLDYNGERFKANLIVYNQWFESFIYRKPGGIQATIRGAFPAFNYAQTQAMLSGGDVNMSFRILNSLEWQGQASYLRAWNTGDNEPLIFMPANRFSNSLKFELAGRGKITNSYIKLNWLHVLEQTLVPTSEDPLERDWRPPPPAYNLVGLDAGTQLNFGGQRLMLIFSVDNLFNTTYRDYLNRFRYFTDELGRNISLRLTYTFKH